MLGRYVAILPFFIVGMPAMAADEPFITGVYLQSEELCQRAQSETLQPVIEEGNIALSARGLESIEYNCEFVQVSRATRAPAWAVTAICQEPGFVFPDVLSILELSPTQLDLVSVKLADPESGVIDNSATYYLCDGVEMP